MLSLSSAFTLKSEIPHLKIQFSHGVLKLKQSQFEKLRRNKKKRRLNLNNEEFLYIWV